MRLLAINFGGLGDEVLFLPTLASIKSAHPDWEITLLTEPRSRAIAQLSRSIDKLIVFDIKKVPLKPADYLQLISLLQAGKYDTVLASGSSSKVCLLLALSGIPRRIGFDSGALSRFLLSRAIPLKKAQYAAFMYHDLVRGLDLNTDANLPKVDLDATALASMQIFLEKEQQQQNKVGLRQKVVIHPGMSRLALEKGIIKTWAAANWCQLIAWLLEQNCQVVLCGGPDDAETIQERLGQDFFDTRTCRSDGAV
jgi:ADP-heptose:LPS heptosyltransferase